MKANTTEASVWPIAWVSFLWSVASLMIFAILPLFLSDVLHVSNTGIGCIEGIAIGSAFSAKVLAGFYSDLMRKRRPLIVIGSVISVATKPMFALAGSWTLIFITRFIDRVSKGVRTAPTDALIADISLKDDLFGSYGIRQALCALGAVVGSVLAVVIMSIWGNEYRLIFWLASIPAAVAVCVLLKYVKDSTTKRAFDRQKWQFSHISQMPKIYWSVLIMAGLLMVARFSEAFMILKAKEVGWSIQYLPFMLIIIDLIHSGFSFLNKRLVAKYGSECLLAYGFLLLIISDCLFSLAQDFKLIIAGVIFNGIHLGVTQGVLRSLVARYSPPHLFGTAFSMFYLVCGIAVLVGNFMAGSLADKFGLYSAFLGGLIVTLVGLIYWFFYIFKVSPKNM